MSGLLAYLQYQALLLWLVLAAGWTWSGVNRRRERLRRLKAAAAATAAAATAEAKKKTPAFVAPTHDDTIASSGGSGGGGDGGGGAATAAAAATATATAAVPPRQPLPPVCVVLPVKGCRPHSLENWESHLGLQYDGPLEFVFVVEAEDDPAVGPLQELIRGRGGEARSWSGGSRTGGRLAAGAAATAPKGPMAAATTSGGVVVGDGATVRLVVAGLAESCSQKAHNLVAGIESCDPRVAAEGGFVLCLDDDVALHPGSLLELVGELRERPGVFMATGYPFDVPPPGSSLPALLVASYHLPLLIAFSTAPDTAFVWGGCMLLRAAELMPGDPGGLLAAWRCGGYSDDLILASYCTERGLSIRVPPFAVFPQKLDPRMTWAAWLNYLHRQLFVLDTYTNEHNRRTNHTMMVLHSLLSWLLVLPSLAALLTLLSRTASLAGGLTALLMSPRPPPSPLPPPPALPPLPGGVVAVAVGWAAAHGALVFMTAETLALFATLSPSVPRIPLAWFPWARLWVAIVASNAALPLVMTYTYLCPTVEWGGVLYRKRRGRVVPLARRPRPPGSGI